MKVRPLPLPQLCAGPRAVRTVAHRNKGCLLASADRRRENARAMARILVGSVPVVGHINPLVPIVRALCARGAGTIARPATDCANLRTGRVVLRGGLVGWIVL